MEREEYPIELKLKFIFKIVIFKIIED